MDKEWINEEAAIRKATQRLMRSVVFAMIGIIACVSISLLVGCKTQGSVSGTETKVVYKTKMDSFLQRDSVWVHDSVLVYRNGDTQYKDRWRTEYRYKLLYRNIGDTIIVNDSVMVPYPVERGLGWWEQTKVDYFVPTVCALLIIFVTLLWIIRKRKNAPARGHENDSEE